MVAAASPGIEKLWARPISLLGASYTRGRERAPRLPVCRCLTGSPLPSARDSQGSFRGMKLKNTPWLMGVGGESDSFLRDDLNHQRNPAFTPEIVVLPGLSASQTYSF